MTKKFSSKQTVITKGVEYLLQTEQINDIYIKNLFNRHFSGDWGDMPKEDIEMNEKNLKSGKGRLFSSFKDIESDKTYWVITEWDRSVTTILFPDEY